jgi:GNAT superfamily N-acetyltransferase
VLEPAWVGRRVSVRCAAGRGDDGRERYSDVVGDLLVLASDRAVVDSRTGPVELDLGSIAAARLSPPSTADELSLERIAAEGWRAADTEALGGWLLRANRGLTGRANSVLPLRAPGMSLDEALQYAARGLPCRLQVPTEARRLLDAELGERGWPASPDVHVMAGRLDHLAREAVPHHRVQLSPHPDDGWLACYRGGQTDPEVAYSLLTRHPRAVFAEVASNGRTLAIGRGVVDEGWLGVGPLEVIPPARRQGLARAVMSALWDWGRDAGASRSYLQAASDNAAAVALYSRLGYYVHHDYRYRSEPPGR